ncbi:MAG: YciI family protein [Caulobacteraceae bacterium]
MLYALLCYNDEDRVFSWTQEEDDKVMAGLAKVHAPLEKARRFGPAARLMPTTAATTLRKDGDPPVVLDGPYAETKEQLLGFYVIDCDDLEGALAVARDFAKANPGGAYEIRPVSLFLPGTLEAASAKTAAE